jgi:hypothetical protein
MFDERSSYWMERGTVALRVGGRVVQFLIGLFVIAFGLGLVGVTVYGLVQPDGALVNYYVVAAGGFEVAQLAASQRMIVMHTDPALLQAASLLAVVSGVRIVLVAALLFAVGLVNAGWKFWREA